MNRNNGGKLGFLFFIVWSVVSISGKLFAGDGKLMAGTAKVNITPGSDEPLHDSIYARSAVLDVRRQAIGFCLR